MGKSDIGNFKQFNPIMVDIINSFKQDTELCKLLYYTDKNPLGQPALTEAQKNDMIFKHIIPVPFISEKKDEESFLVITFDKIAPSAENPKFKNFIISIDILSHINLWGTKQGLRPFLIMERIDTILNQNKSLGIGALNFAGAGLIVLTSELVGYSLKYYNVESNY